MAVDVDVVLRPSSAGEARAPAVAVRDEDKEEETAVDNTETGLGTTVVG
jgi:hypothetical protein